MSLQSIYNFNGLGATVDPLYDSILDGLSAGVMLGTEIRFPSGFSLAPMVQYDGLGTQQFAAIQGSIRISIPLDDLQTGPTRPRQAKNKTKTATS